MAEPVRNLQPAFPCISHILCFIHLTRNKTLQQNGIELFPTTVSPFILKRWLFTNVCSQVSWLFFSTGLPITALEQCYIFWPLLACSDAALSTHFHSDFHNFTKTRYSILYIDQILSFSVTSFVLFQHILQKKKWFLIWTDMSFPWVCNLSRTSKLHKRDTQEVEMCKTWPGIE